jgi:hypothetical protein
MPPDEQREPIWRMLERIRLGADLLGVGQGKFAVLALGSFNPTWGLQRGAETFPRSVWTGA